MKRFPFVLTAALALCAAALAPPALAKGPSQARITGHGLGKPLSFKGTESSGRLGELTQYAGFFPAAFGQQPDPMLHRRPIGRLGPSFTIHYVVPAGVPRRFRLTQEVYPYANGGAVTYMKPGQPIFDTRTRGGWYRGGIELAQTLRRAGLPRTAPRAAPSAHGRNTASSEGGSHLAAVLGIGAPGALLLLGAATLVARRRTRG